MKQSKRFFALLLAMLLLLSACGNQPTEEPLPEDKPPVNDTPATPAEPDPVPEEPADPLDELRENFPLLDGSTSLIPLEAGIRAALFHISTEEATKAVSHTTTWGSFYRLLEGAVDLIFSTPISEEQKRLASEAEVELEQVPVVREAFVFVVNAANPVDTLTQQQIRDIYSGKITNWKELGGNDEPIVAFQRNNDSGSQNYMQAFMGDTPLMEAPSELRPASMSGLMSVIAPNDGSVGSIGYSVYAYAADMYGLGDNIKFIQVDGVAPTKETMISDAYPLTSFNYAIFRADAAEDDPVRTLVEWITSYDGQLAIAQAGYATLEDIGYSYAQQELTLYAGTGSGIAYPGSVPTYQYAIDADREDWCSWHLDEVGQYYRFTGGHDPAFLTDDTLRQEVLDFIQASAPIVTEDYDAMCAMIEQNNAGSESASYSGYIPYYLTGLDDWFSGLQLAGENYAVSASVKNGYLSVAVSMCYTESFMDGYPRYYRTETAVWDLFYGKRLAPEELFYEGVDIARALNDYLSTKCQQPEDYKYGLDYRMKTEYAGLLEQGWHLTADAIYFDQDNPYFSCGYRFSLDDLPEGIMVTEQPRDMSQALNTPVTKQFRVITDSYEACSTDAEDFCSYRLLKENAYPGWEKINQTIQKYIDKYCTKETVYAYYEKLGITDPQFDIDAFDFSMTDLGGKYILVTSRLPDVWVDNPQGYSELDPDLDYPYWEYFIFDAETGKQLKWTDLLVGDWESAMIFGNENAFLPDENYRLVYFETDSAQGPTFVFQRPNDETYSGIRLTIPAEYVRW